MRTLKKIPITLVEVEFIPEIENMEFGKLYYSKEYQTTNHLCPCGCGMQTPVPIKEGEWHISITNNQATITPSILQRGGCRSHYIIEKGIAKLF